MAQLRHRDFSDVRALRLALEQLNDLDNSNGPLGPAVERVHRVLRKRPFRVFGDAPPSASPLVQFLATEAGAGLTAALTTLSWMLSFNILGDSSGLFRDDPSLGRNVCRWVNYMSMFNHGIRLSDMSHDQRTMLFAAMDGVSRFLSIVTCALDPSLSKAIILSPENIIRTAVNAYFSSPQLYASGMPHPAHPLLAFECASTLPFTLRIITSQGELYPKVATEVLRIVGSDPRRLYDVAAQHITMLLEGDIRGEMAVHLDTHLVFIGIVALYPDLQASPSPRRLISALVSVMRAHHIKDLMKEEGLSNVAYKILTDLCALDARTTVRALQKGVFPILVSIRQKNPGSDITDLLDCIKACLVFRRAIRTFEQDAASTAMLFLPSDMRQVVSLARDRQRARKLADEDWQRVAKCCNTQCTSPADAPLRACPCTEALYCSRSCQRYHWTEGGHRAACQRAENGTGASMSARDVHFISQIVNYHVGQQFSEIVKDDRCAYVSMELDGDQPDMESLHLDDGDPQNPRIVVDVEVPYSGWRTLSLLIRPRQAQGQERFRLLTHGYSAQWDMFDK